MSLAERKAGTPGSFHRVFELQARIVASERI
jgi:hypothetical protein